MYRCTEFNFEFKTIMSSYLTPATFFYVSTLNSPKSPNLLAGLHVNNK